MYSSGFNSSLEPKFRFTVMVGKSHEEYCAIAIGKKVDLNGPVHLSFFISSTPGDRGF